MIRKSSWIPRSQPGRSGAAGGLSSYATSGLAIDGSRGSAELGRALRLEVEVRPRAPPRRAARGDRLEERDGLADLDRDRAAPEMREQAVELGSVLDHDRVAPGASRVELSRLSVGHAFL